ncbi:MAG: MATE family efflux transporter [Campylobacterales bacterium]
MTFSKKRVSRILNIALPAAANSFMDILNVLIDLIMVGMLSSAALAAVGVSMQFIMLNFAFVTIFYVGTNALVSRFVGAEDYNSANAVTSSLLVVSLVVGVLLFFVDMMLKESYLSWMELESESFDLGLEYLSILIFTIPFLFSRAVLVSSFSASGDTKTPMKIKIVSSIANVFFNYLLIFGNFGFPALGVAGAAIATLIANTIEASFYLYIYFFGKKNIYFVKAMNFGFVKRAFRVGYPTGIERFMTFLAFVLISKFIATYGTQILAGSQAALRVEGLAFMPGVGFMIASMALIGQAIGAKNYTEAREEIYSTAVLASIVMGVIGVLMVIFSVELASVFSDNPQTIDAASLYLEIMGFSQVPLAVIFVFEGALRGAGATRITFLVNLVGLWVFRIVPIYFISYFTYPVIGIFLVIFAETYLRSVVFWYLFKRGVWMGIKV